MYKSTICISGYTNVFPMSISTCYQIECTSWIQVSILAVVNALIYPFVHLSLLHVTRFLVLEPVVLCFSVHCS